MTVQRGDKLKYLGMELDFGAKGEVTITMNSYIKEALEEFPEDKWIAAASPASDHLFKVNANGRPLTTKMALLFHRLVAKLLFISTRARPDMYPTRNFVSEDPGPRARRR